MANKYGEIAVATALVCQRNRSDIRDEWGKQAMYAFEGQPTSQKKGCPKSAFLALCEAGFIKGISKGNYGTPKESKNGYYAKAAAGALLVDSSLSKKELWEISRASVDNPATNESNQIEIVIALYQHEPRLLKLP
ncbi:DUF6979 family protein [Yersinia rohdei]|uniref:DUF6979 family protein n=1 Tax=Yersinia rohdei TaxID=29485 RepID=UPI0025AA3E6F|nr:hypothetical protein [Yersinia rohdei]MDN0094566.1 hypothetical protein [Yersinia rohdei]